MPNHDNSEYFFDRNPLMFAYILDSFRKGSVHLPKDICGTTFMEELEFWEVSLRHVAPCCLEALYKSENDMSTIQKLLKDYENKTNVFLMRQKDTSVKTQMWLFMDEPTSSKLALIWATFISLLIVLSTFAEALSTVPAFDVNYTESEKQVLRKIGLFLNWDNATFIGMYWALITVTTVGYGDYVPISPVGYVIAGACAVCGILILALPIGIVASSFCTFYNYRKFGRRHFQISIDGHKSTNK
ncbi:potassium voltage-gated channel protein Shaw-like [Mercenaria mercenaria]|uniref:potassium voltage-gated channel protein Shaw-like n=1 Tax=Mercenaria mercenaria TaxID=6596 RepID=UPI00234F07E6|nr:potassium voltage-gated channel protein Shaw-like [Mercenaria mercenaria]